MAIRRYILQTKQKNSHLHGSYHVGTFEDCSKFMSNMISSGGYDLYEWIRLNEQVYTKNTDTWVDTKVIKFKEFN